MGSRIAGAMWAKTGANGAHLPLGDHLRDVAAVGQRLSALALTDRQRAWLARGLGLEQADACAWVGFLAAVHDIGKANPHFQSLDPDLARQVLPAELHAPARGAYARHDVVSGAVLDEWLEARGASGRLRRALVATVSGHHRIPRPPDEVKTVRLEVLAPDGAWATPRTELIDDLARELGVAALPDVPPYAITLALAGLVSAADWIGSDSSRFPVRVGPRDSGALAETAVRASAWAPNPAPVAPSFKVVFGRSPRATQQAVVDALATVEQPALLLLEDRTGAGKTEAALWTASRALEAGARGLYVALPTRATADQIHARAQRFLASLWPELSTLPRLLHGGVHPGDDEPAPVQVGPDDDQPDADAEAARWFAQSRRGLLAPFAVGTLDQALMSVLQARHFPVRMWGLQGKVVVLDEVHAYDAYTELLLERLIGWLAALDCWVVLLSATLPVARRTALVAAYRRGLGQPRAPSELGVTAYPRVTLASGSDVRTIAVTDDRPGRRVGLQWRGVAEDADDVARLARDTVARGGCAALVCSTVALAQQRFRALRALDPDLRVELLHARMRPLERTPIEQRLLDALGPPTPTCERPARVVVVATQVIEQSLDLDFDVMLSDLAPVDLLVQRAGRVHRHGGRERPDAHREPRLVLLDALPGDVTRPLPPGASVYAAATLVRTRLALRGREALREPEDLDELIAQVYGTPVPSGAQDHEAEEVVRLDRRADECRRRLGGWAREGAVPPPEDDRVPWRRVHALVDPEDPDSDARASAVTRWTDLPSIQAVLLKPDELPTARRSPSAAERRELLLRAVSISSPPVYRALLSARDAITPPAWRKDARLRHHVLVELDSEGCAREDLIEVRLMLRDGEGVVVEETS